ncbi:unnamed protein product [Durusdinium trenchii]|uniref:Uncharacterized protein n=1 Tax=Durusdinium trenchii TaxID=1381693 RepID=A0ABP0JR06_9DINO
MVPIITGMPWLTYVLLAIVLVMLVGGLLALHSSMRTAALEDAPRISAHACTFTSFLLTLCMVTVASFLANNSSNWFPSPSQPARQPCGLAIPDYRDDTDDAALNATAQYFDTWQKRWIWVDLSMVQLPEVEKKQWEYTQSCVNIFTYDIVTTTWARKCSEWCQKHFGNFVWNEACAFGLVTNENPKPMNVLRACQKASFCTNHFTLSSDSVTKICILIALLAFCSGFAAYRLNENQSTPKFSSAAEPGKLKLAPFVEIPGVSRKTEIIFDVLKMTSEMMLDVFSDFAAGLMYFSHGQIFLGFYMFMVLASAHSMDLLGTKGFAQLCWSLEHAVPNAALIRRKSVEVAESSAGLICIALFFLRVPAHDQNDQPLLSQMDLVVYSITLITSLTGIYSGAEASIQGHLLSLNPDMELDMDKRYEKFKEKSVPITMFALGALCSRVSVSLTIALVIEASSAPFATAMHIGNAGCLVSLAVACAITLMTVVLMRYFRPDLRLSLNDIVVVLSNNFGFVSLAFASCFTAGFLKEMRDEGDWDNLPWHDVDTSDKVWNKS